MLCLKNHQMGGIKKRLQLLHFHQVPLYLNVGILKRKIKNIHGERYREPVILMSFAPG